MNLRWTSGKRAAREALAIASSRRKQSGMSLLEVLIGMALMATIAIAILPLFSRSLRQNREGEKYTDLGNIARSSLEEYDALDFNAAALTIAAGSTQSSLIQYWDGTTRRWITVADLATAPAGVRWARTILVQQYASGDLLDNGVLDSPLDGATSQLDVQLKLVTVTVRPMWTGSGFFGTPTPVTLQLLKAV
jgi:prepilin-type N-terminal cleavage/methylation domain-containing protein